MEMTVAAWCAATANRVGRIEISDGYGLGAGGVEALMQATSPFAPPPPG